MTNRVAPRTPIFGVWLIVAGFLGLLAAFELTVEKFIALTDPNSGPAACDFSVIVQCSANLDSWQGAVLGFPNPLIGLVAWPFVLATGVLILGRVALPAFWFYGLFTGFLGAVGFTTWLEFQSIMVLGTLCPWCMVTWFATVTAFVALVGHMGRLALFGRKAVGFFEAMKPYTVLIALLWLVGIATWAQLRLDWIRNVFVL